MARGGKRPGGGRPKGSRNKVTADIKAICQQHGPAMVKRLSEIALSRESSETASVAAIREILDRGFGKSTQGHQHTGANGGPIQTVDLTGASHEQLAALAAVFGPLAGSGDDDAGDPSGAGAESDAGGG